MYGASTSVGGAVRRGKRAVTRARRIPATAPSVSDISSIGVRANAKREELQDYINAIRLQGAALQGVASNLRNNLAPEIQDYMGEFSSYLAFVDSIVNAWGLEFGDWRDEGLHHHTRPSSIEGTSTSSIIRNVRNTKSVFNTIEGNISWFYPVLRSEIGDVFVQLRNLSTALHDLGRVMGGVFGDALDLYDLGEGVHDAGVRWASMPITSAASEICTSYISHSNWRRLRLGRNPGKHAAWDEVCDRWENPKNGDYVYWSRAGDPMPFGKMSNRLKRGKQLVERGCLPGEVCNTAYTGGYKVPTLESAQSLVAGIRTTLDTPVVDNVFIEARRLIGEVKDVISEVLSHLNGIMAGADHILVPAFIENAIDDALNPLVTQLRGVKRDLRSKQTELTDYKNYWRSGPWRASVAPPLDVAETVADNLEALRSSGIQSACNFIYPKVSTSSAALSSYWQSQGVGTSCMITRGKPLISWERERRLDLPTGRGEEGAGGLPGAGGGKELEALTPFGAIPPTEPKRIMGLLPWQALALIAGAWMLWPEKK